MRLRRGQRFGTRVIVRYAGMRAGKNPYYFALCDLCHKTHSVRGRCLTMGQKHNCVGSHRTHGKSGTRTHSSWASMNHRCNSPNATQRSRYHDIGVRVCKRWRKFENFLADMGERPVGTTLGRYLDTGNYEPGNCEWMTRAQQGAEKKGRVAMMRFRNPNFDPSAERSRNFLGQYSSDKRKTRRKQ
jgi:hypothetical protein